KLRKVSTRARIECDHLSGPRIGEKQIATRAENPASRVDVVQRELPANVTRERINRTDRSSAANLRVHLRITSHVLFPRLKGLQFRGRVYCTRLLNSNVQQSHHGSLSIRL